ncbi:MAG: hypothetical protein WA096_06525 [Smithella sp.]
MSRKTWPQSLSLAGFDLKTHHVYVIISKLILRGSFIKSID